MKTYHRQNFIQKQLAPFECLFNNITYQMKEMKSRGLDFYNPRVNRVKLSIGLLLIVGCLCTWGTNLMILPIGRWMLR